MDIPRRKNEASWLRTGSGTREGSLFPARFSQRKGEPAGSALSPEWIFPAEGTKQAGRGRGVGREEEAHSPPGSAVVGKTGGEQGVHGRGTPRPVQPWKSEPTGSRGSTEEVFPAVDWAGGGIGVEAVWKAIGPDRGEACRSRSRGGRRPGSKQARRKEVSGVAESGQKRPGRRNKPDSCQSMSTSAKRKPHLRKSDDSHLGK